MGRKTAANRKGPCSARPHDASGFGSRCTSKRRSHDEYHVYLGAFIDLPGDTGTLEEVPEVISLIALAQFDAPCILFNLNGFYDDLHALLSRTSDMGLCSPRRQRGIHFAHSLEEMANILVPLH